MFLKRNYQHCKIPKGKIWKIEFSIQSKEGMEYSIFERMCDTSICPMLFNLKTYEFEDNSINIFYILNTNWEDQLRMKLEIVFWTFFWESNWKDLQVKIISCDVATIRNILKDKNYNIWTIIRFENSTSKWRLPNRIQIFGYASHQTTPWILLWSVRNKSISSQFGTSLMTIDQDEFFDIH